MLLAHTELLMCITAIMGSVDLCSESPGVKLRYHREKMGVKMTGDGCSWGICDCKVLLDTLCSAITRVITENPLLKSKNNSPRTWDHNVSFHVVLIQKIIWYTFQSSRTWTTRNWTWAKLGWCLKQHNRTCQPLSSRGILLVILDYCMINFDRSN